MGVGTLVNDDNKKGFGKGGGPASTTGSSREEADAGQPLTNLIHGYETFRSTQHPVTGTRGGRPRWRRRT